MAAVQGVKCRGGVFTWEIAHRDQQFIAGLEFGCYRTGLAKYAHEAFHDSRAPSPCGGQFVNRQLLTGASREVQKGLGPAENAFLEPQGVVEETSADLEETVQRVGQQ